MPLKARHLPQRTHKKPTQHFIKVYWPYLPLAVSIALCLAVALQFRPQFLRRGVLAYATDVSPKALLVSTNKQRLANGSPVLKINSKLNAAAQAKANDMAKRNYWAHITPDGKLPWYFFGLKHYAYLKAGENLAYGFDNSGAAVAGWMNSAGHRANLLDTAFIEVGFGIANSANYQHHGPQTIIVALYGRPLAAGIRLGSPPQPVTAPVLPAKQISVAQTLTNGRAPWSGLAVSFAVGALTMYLLLKHGFNLRRALRASEKFIFRHPLVDATIISLIILGLMLIQSSGFIN